MESIELVPGIGPELTRWMARLAVAGWTAWLLLAVAAAPATTRRCLWTVGLLAHLGHVFCAFHFIHHWSHAEAVLHTARLTERVTGLSWGQGVWINYVFTLVWVADAAWWWCRPAETPRRPGRAMALHGFFAFLFFNATIVFGPWIWKPVGAGVAVLTGVAWIRRRRIVSGGRRPSE